MKAITLNLKSFAKPRNLVFYFIILTLITSFFLPGLRAKISAQTCNSITECQNKIAADKNTVEELKKTAIDYQDAIEKLGSQINNLQGSIEANISEQNRLQSEIEKAQAEIVRQRSILAEGVRIMYVDGAPTTLEMLVASNGLSDYVDKQEYRNAVQRKLQDTLQKIAELQKQLSEQRVQVTELIGSQKSQQADLESTKVEQSSMLSYNKAQQDKYNAQTAANKAKLEELIAAQRRANSASYAPGSIYFIRVPGEVKSHDIDVDDYPYKDAGFNMSTSPGCGHIGPPFGQRDATDRWGYCTRQCVSYAAWAVERSGRTAPTNWHNAKDWIRWAKPNWIYRTPKVGDIAISTGGTWGHAMYVEAVKDGKILVSQYNAQLTGRYSTAWRSY